MHKEYLSPIDGSYLGYSPGNVKIYYSDNRVIYKIYPFDIILDRPKTERKEKEKETSVAQAKLNLQNKKIELLGLGMCNKWQYFFTGTLDPKKFNTDFDTVSKKISYEFKKMRRLSDKVEYCFILEKFKKGDYHAHGFVNLPDKFVVKHIPCYIQDDGYKVYPSKSQFIQWGIDQKYYSLGLNVISPIMSMNSVSDYCAKYIIKDPARGKKDSKSIFKSHGLNKFEVQYGHFNCSDQIDCQEFKYIYDHHKDGCNDIEAGDLSIDYISSYRKFYDGDIFTIDIKLD